MDDDILLLAVIDLAATDAIIAGDAIIFVDTPTTLWNVFAFLATAVVTTVAKPEVNFAMGSNIIDNNAMPDNNDVIWWDYKSCWLLISST